MSVSISLKVLPAPVSATDIWREMRKSHIPKAWHIMAVLVVTSVGVGLHVFSSQQSLWAFLMLWMLSLLSAVVLLTLAAIVAIGGSRIPGRLSIDETGLWYYGLRARIPSFVDAAAIVEVYISECDNVACVSTIVVDTNQYGTLEYPVHEAAGNVRQMLSGVPWFQVKQGVPE